MHMSIGCVILAGGKSSRMGMDKALLNYEGTNFIKKISDELSCFEEKMIARGNNSELDNIPWEIIADIYPGHGPIGGLHAALSACGSEAMLCVSCDMPLLERSLALRLCEAMSEECDAVVAMTENGRIHPLCAVYRKELYTLLEEQILAGNNRLMSVLDQIRVKVVNVNTVEETKQLTNVNTREEYLEIQRLCYDR
ncbi:MAG: molybdenum cofactor guanylyltransferase [Dorea sp.]